MPLEQFIKETVAATPHRKVEGKKRLQKLVFLLDQAGFESGASFLLKDYGPFSREVESAADIMSVFGDLAEQPVQTGYSNYIAIEYSLPDTEGVSPSKEMVDIVEFLDRFRTVELEIASTIRFFEISGASRSEAVDRTKQMKPSKSTERVISAANSILSRI
jgi:uncharacterized protein YwgA